MREELTEPNLPDPGPPLGIGPAAEPGLTPAPDSSPQPVFPEHAGGSGSLDSRPHFYDGGYPVTLDRMHWWNGSMWVLGSPPGSDQPSQGIDGYKGSSPLQIVIAIGGLILFGAVAFSMCQSMPGTGTLTP